MSCDYVCRVHEVKALRSDSANKVSPHRVEVQMSPSNVTSSPGVPSTNTTDPDYIRALAESTDLSLLITKDKHWEAAALRCRLYPHEAR